MKTRIDVLYEKMNEKLTGKREPWSARHLSVFSEPGWEDKPLIVRRAKAIELQLTHMPAQIEDGELIVGKIPLGNFVYGTTFPTYATEEEIKSAGKNGIGLKSVWGHYVPDYTKILNAGLSGIEAEAQLQIKSLVDGPIDQRKRNFLEAVVVTMGAVRKLTDRYREMAKSLALKARGSRRSSELEMIAQILSRVPEKPAMSFHEALQSFWLTFVTLHSTMNNVPVGRFDTFMWPFLERDLSQGVLSKDDAQELVDCLWLKFNERSMFSEPDFNGRDFILIKQSKLMERHVALYNHWLQNVMLGGQDSEGNDATNELSYMCLEASKKFDLTQPTVSVRIHPGSPDKLLELAGRMIQKGSGMPSIYNDPVLIDGLEHYGFPREKARGFSNDGCWEILIPGEAEFRWGPVHALQCLEFALTNGKSRVFTKTDVPSLHLPVRGTASGDSKDFVTFEDLRRAFMIQLDHQIDTYMAQSRALLGKHYELVPVPFLSALVGGCLEKAMDITEGGARYYMNGVMMTGLPNTSDSLSAIKTLVFDQQRISLGDLLVALERDFDGHEKLRQLLINKSPKYGNDEDLVDRIGVDIARHFAERVISNNRKCQPITFTPGIATFEDYDLFGRMVGATPDGRKAQAPLAPNLGPVPGRDITGPTALIHSFGKFEHEFLAAGAELNLSMNTKDFEGEVGLGRLTGLIKAFLKTKGTVLNIALNDVETLKKAQQSPEEYRNLRVRMGGWSAYFVLLDKRNQDHHIARYSH